MQGREDAGQEKREDNGGNVRPEEPQEKYQRQEEQEKEKFRTVVVLFHGSQEFLERVVKKIRFSVSLLCLSI
jgi:hypothetical protein